MGKYKINSYEKYVRSLSLSSKKLLKFLIYISKKQLKLLVVNLQTFYKYLQTTKAYHWLDPRNYTGTRRLLQQTLLLAMTGLLLFSAISPLIDLYVTHRYYSLNSSTSGLVGNVTDTLAKQITYDSTREAYVFNASGMTPATQTVGPDKVPLALLQAKVAGNKSKSKSTYSVVMPTDPKAGISYYDSNTGLSFQLVPNFTEMSAQQINNHIVYPTSGNTQMVYSVKNNGLKEDIILKQYTSDSLAFSYSLKLPKTLEARLLTDGSGSLGIYSADPSLFNNATSGSDYDPAKIESAQLHAQKDHLVFAVPAPVIKQTGQSGQGTANAYFRLSPDGQTLTVSANNLRGLHYPITVDPTVVITSTSDFSTGNNEDNNISYPANQINRGSLTGGSISGGWTGTMALPVATFNATSVTYNGYVYEIGGDNPTITTAVYYAPINANGTIGAWNATTPLPTATDGSTSVAYNGYIYEIGGTNGSVAVNNVYYAPINSNGTIGAWTLTNGFTGARYAPGTAVYNGFLYVMGGNPVGGVLSDTQYAPINANGTIGTWTATTSLPATRQMFGTVAYNGYIYMVGGWSSGAFNDTYYARLNANGTIGTWVATTSFNSARYVLGFAVYNGYLYIVGGYNGTSYFNDVQYAPINANGTVGSWTASSTIATATGYDDTLVYNGYIYEIGGNTGSPTTTVSYAKIDPAGTTTAYTATTALPAATLTAASVAYNGYIYEIGGYNSSITAVTTVDYAPINSNGTIGAWTATTALPTATAYPTAATYNGYLYVLGGKATTTAFTTVYYAAIASTGAVGSWTTTTALPAGTIGATSFAYNGYIYEIGGYDNGSTYFTTVEYAAIATNGTIGAWTTTTALPAATAFATSVVYNGYVYEIGGSTGSTVATVDYAPINTNGTIGAWTATTALPLATRDATSVAYNGYIYEIGGINTSSTATVNYAPINTNGTIGAWTATTALPLATANATSVVYNGFVYEIGGNNGSVTTTVEYAFINNGGTGTIGAWTATTGLPTTINWATSVVYNGYVYEIGGNSGSTTLATVYFAPINANGTIGTWAATTSLPTTTYYANSVAYNGYLYEIGGDNGSGAINAVLYAPINTDGTIGAWTATTALPLANNRSTSVAYNGYLYEIGGYDGAANTATVNYAPINANGTIGAWTATTALPTATRFAASVVYNGYLYAIGGYTSAPIATVEYAPINANGTIGAWTATTSLPIATSVATYAAYNGYIYEVGGDNPSVTATVNSVSVNANGSIGTWTATTSLPAATDHATSIIYNGYIYEIGGWNGSATVTTVNYAPLNVMPRVGHYSSLFSFNSLITPVSLTYNGSLPNAYGLSSIQYRTAGSNGVFGSNQLSSVMNGSATSCTPGSAQYLEATLTLDDSNSAGFPDVNSTPANVTDFTLTYSTAHPQPNLRLRGGKFFFNNSLQPLDSCQQVPNAPTIGTATTGGLNATVTFTDNAVGDSPITSHTVTSYPGGLTATGSSPVTISGLTAGVNYTFTVTATNSQGTSAPSAASNVVTTGSIVTGGTLTADATYYYRTFTSSGTLNITGAPLTADVMVVGGGGSGGWPYSGGGGGGGFLLNSGVSLSATSHTVTVGAGAPGAYNTGNGQKGGDSSLDSYIATGGGGGVGDSAVTSVQNGGSGGGGADITRNPTGNNGGTGVAGQGFAGGKGSPVSSTQSSGGGGGGAGAAGANATTAIAGVGGIGKSVSWPPVFTGSLNYLDNGNMENWTAGTSVVPDYWQDPGYVTMTRDSTIVKEGNYSLKAVWGNYYPQINQNIDITNHPERLGKTYTASAWIYDTTGTGTNTSLHIYNGLTSVAEKAHTSASGWELVQETFTLPSNSTQFRVGVGIISGTIYIDDVQVHDYVPGTGEWGYFAGGGGGGTSGAFAGGSTNTGLGGFGGGGRGATNDGSQEADAGLPNTGGGSGGGGAGNAPNSPKPGGSGIVVIRYLRSAVARPVASPEKTPTVEYLVVAGGGAGGYGGGGAGGFRTATGYSVTPGTAYTVTVGGGGVGYFANGSNSVFDTITAIGGGGGADSSGGAPNQNGKAGGSGGGAYGSPSFTGGAGTSGQGNAGGNASGGRGAGGGGAGTAGQNESGGNAGSGGGGLPSSISGVSTYYAGGGGGYDAVVGGHGTYGLGGIGGGGAEYYAATANTGGGGGGAGSSGGSGIVILRYPDAYPDAVSTTGLPTYNDIGGFKIYIFKSSGSITF